MKLNIEVRTIASAEGWVAEYGHNRVPLICWALTEDGGLVGLTLGAGRDARSAEDPEPVDGSNFTGYRFMGSAVPH
jgi:hypothetical protein